MTKKFVAAAFAALFSAGTFVSAQVTWVRNRPNGAVPKHAVVAGQENGRSVYVCRAQLPDGMHPGKTTGPACIVGQKNKTAKLSDFEFATARQYSWGARSWDDAIIGGRQFGQVDLYVCRGHVVVSSADYGFYPGKAYRAGPHANHCYVPFQDRELDFAGDFQLLHPEKGRAK